MTSETRPLVVRTAHDWAQLACEQPATLAQPHQVEPVLRELIQQLLDLAATEPFPVAAARTLGARLALAPFEQIRMLALATRTLLGFPAGQPGSLIATRWPFVASQAIDSYAQALQERALAQQEQNLSAAVTLRVQEIAALQDRLRHEATHDALTDLANRTLLQDRLREMAADPGMGIGLLLVDLDRFKQVNDGYGHGVGDEVLVEIAQRLREVCPPDALICRYGGDEFVMAINPTRNDITDLAHRTVAALRDPVWSSVGPVSISASVGTAQSRPGASGDLADLLRRADLAMYSAKAAGGHRYEVGGVEDQKSLGTAVAG